jgi:hypothetical protein
MQQLNKLYEIIGGEANFIPKYIKTISGTGNDRSTPKPKHP